MAPNDTRSPHEILRSIEQKLSQSLAKKSIATPRRYVPMPTERQRNAIYAAIDGRPGGAQISYSQLIRDALEWDPSCGLVNGGETNEMIRFVLAERAGLAVQWASTRKTAAEMAED